jgi:hypothetical protein
MSLGPAMVPMRWEMEAPLCSAMETQRHSTVGGGVVRKLVTEECPGKKLRPLEKDNRA